MCYLHCCCCTHSMSLRDKRKGEDVDCLASTSVSKLKECLRWIESCGGIGLCNLDFKVSMDCSSLGCFALKNFKVGELLFSIPQSCIFGFQNSLDSTLTPIIFASAKQLGLCESITAEFVIWLHMIAAKEISGHEYHAYFTSLSDAPPNIRFCSSHWWH